MNWSIECGDCIEWLKKLPDDSVHCCVTSPPYYGLRDYGVEGQIGLEPSVADYVERLRGVCAEVRRVLRPDGTCWLNLGDSYCTVPHGPKGVNTHDPKYNGGRQRLGNQANRIRQAGFKHKDLMGVPWRVAFALQADGWYLRSDIIWSKPNPMTESVRDRPTKAHEYVFLLTKSPRYFYDAKAIAEPASGLRGGSSFGKQRQDTSGTRAQSRRYERPVYTTRNARSVWRIATKAYRGAHFAVMPAELVRRCILAGCPVGGTVLDPFAGSGTTLAVACENGRRATGCELNPKYIDLIRERLATITPTLRLEDNDARHQGES